MKSKYQSPDDKSGDPRDHEHPARSEESPLRLSPGRAVKCKVGDEKSQTNRDQPDGNVVYSQCQADCEADYSP